MRESRIAPAIATFHQVLSRVSGALRQVLAGISRLRPQVLAGVSRLRPQVLSGVSRLRPQVLAGVSRLRPQVLSRTSWPRRPARLTTLVAALTLVIACFVALVSVTAIQSRQSTDAASGAYQAQRDQLRESITKASSQGYTSQDLAPITERLRHIDSRVPPLWFGSRSDFYRQQTRDVIQLRGSLQVRIAQVLEETRSTAVRNVDGARGEVQKDQQLGLDTASLRDLQGRLNELTQSQQQARSLSDYLRVEGLAQLLTSDAQTLGKVQQDENRAIEQAAQQLIAEKGGDINALAQIVKGGLPQARNDASIAAYMNYGHQFKGDNRLLDVASERLERYGLLAGSSDVSQVAQAAAAIQRYGAQIHQIVFGQFPAKMIVVSFQDQHVWAYENGKAVMDAATTTGIRGVTDYGTDFGPLKVSSKDHPWKMHSPYPRSSPLWYEDAVVQWAVWFTPNKLESFHDAYWEADSQLGPGSQYDPSTRSHGCIHVPLSTAQWMYDWSDVGTPVIIFPGNGQPVPEQRAEITTDELGRPQTSA